MTTQLLDNQIVLFSFFVISVMAFPKKSSILGRFPLSPQHPPSQKKGNIYFYCRLAVSDILTLEHQEMSAHKHTSRSERMTPDLLMAGQSRCATLPVFGLCLDLSGFPDCLHYLSNELPEMSALLAHSQLVIHAESNMFEATTPELCRDGCTFEHHRLEMMETSSMYSLVFTSLLPYPIGLANIESEDVSTQEISENHCM